MLTAEGPYLPLKQIVIPEYQTYAAVVYDPLTDDPALAVIPSVERTAYEALQICSRTGHSFFVLHAALPPSCFIERHGRPP